MPSTEIKPLEDAIIAKLQSDILSLKTIKRYQGDFDTENLATLTSLFPAALIYYGGGSLGSKNRDLTGSRRFTIFLADKNARSRTKAREDIYDFLELVPVALMFTSIAGYYLELSGETMIYHDKYITIYAQDYSYELEGRTSSRAPGTYLERRWKK